MSTRVIAAIVAAAVLATAGRLSAQSTGIAVGAVAPDAMVETLDGKPVALRTLFDGKPVVMEFWATWCPLCKELEAPLEAARARHAGRVTFISVGVMDNQTPERQKAYVESRKLGGAFVFDRAGRAVAAYQVPHTSYLVVIGGDGKVVYTGVGADQDVEAAIAKAFEMRMPGGR